MGVTPLIITPNDLVVKFLLPDQGQWPDLKVLIHKGFNPSIRRHNGSIKLNVKTATWSLWASHSREPKCSRVIIG